MKMSSRGNNGTVSFTECLLGTESDCRGLTGPLQILPAALESGLGQVDLPLTEEKEMEAQRGEGAQGPCSRRQQGAAKV